MEARAPSTGGKLHMALLLAEWLQLGRNTLATLSVRRTELAAVGVGEGAGEVVSLFSQLCFLLRG